MAARPSVIKYQIQTLCLSIDAADKDLYEKLRVNGKYEKIIKNVKRLKKIKESEYPNTKLTTRISGVKVNKNQNLIITHYYKYYNTIR